MDSSLDSIWDEPVLENSPKRPSVAQDEGEDAPRPSKRPRQSLFFSDSEDDDENISGPSRARATHKAPPVQEVDIDALFADFDDEEALRPLPARINEEELTRQAEARYRRNPPPLTPYEILPSSSPQRDTGAASGGKGSAQDKGQEEKKARRQVVKLDEARIMSPNYGFPQLIKMTKDFKIKGKGHEATDLNRLLQQYQYWTHQLYPKTPFHDTVERVEKLCHSRRLNVALSVWRDEFHGRTGQRHAIEDEDDDNAEINDENQVDGTRMVTDDNSSRPSRSSSSLPSSRASSPPVTSGPESDHTPASRTTPHSEMGEPDEDEDFWRSLDEVDGGLINANAPRPVTAPASAPATMDVDEDMWDLIDEVTKESAAPTKPPSAPTAPTAPEPAPNTDYRDPSDWDDMYL